MTRNLNQEIIALIDKYGTDYKRALKENRQLDYLYALGVLRENLLEWYPFDPEGTLLQAGADFGALTGLFARRVKRVTVLDQSEEALSVVRRRFCSADNVDCRQKDLISYAKEDHPSYDYVTLIGSLERGERRVRQLDAAKTMLAPGGRLILAACNRFGMKYWAGAKPDSAVISKRELDRLLPGGACYYPQPDFRLPSTIYSEGYLPKRGDLTGALPLYDYPKYLMVDVGAAYDEVCGDGQFENFANSFLVIWEKGKEA